MILPLVYVATELPVRMMAIQRRDQRKSGIGGMALRFVEMGNAS